MPLAAPLILPFAQLAGITIAGLGMAAASEKVGDFISENPELSKQILITLVPGGAGLNTLFKKEAGITLEDLDEMTDEEAADLSKEDKAEIMKEVGKSKGGDKRQRMIEISEKLGLSGEGKEKQTIVDEVEERYDEGGVEDAPKPKFDYKKFFRNRRADGGAIGIEVLFEEKKDGGRIGFANGGDNIIGADLKDSFFNTLYGQDTIADLEAQYGLGGSGKPSQARHQAAVNELSKNLNIGNFGPGNLFTALGASATEIPDVIRTGDIKESARDIFDNLKGALVTDKSKTSADVYRDIYETPTNQQTGIMQNISDFFFAPAGAAEISPTTNRNFDRDFSQLPSYGNTPTRTNVQGMDLEMDPAARINPNIQPQQNIFQRVGNTIQSGLGSLKDFMPFIGNKSLTGMAMRGLGRIGEGIGNFFRGNPEQRARNAYNSQFSTGDTYGYGMGAGNLSNQDAFGYNTVSRLGDYEQHMKDKVEELEDLLTRTNRKSFKPGTYQFNMLKDYTKNINKIQEDDRIRQEEEQRTLAETLARVARENRAAGYQDYGSGAASQATQDSYAGADGSYAGASTQDYGSGEKDGGIIGYQNGGVASMFVEKR